MIEKIEWHRYHKTHSATANSCDKCFQSLHPWRWKTWIKVPQFSNNSQYPCMCKIKSPHSVHEEIHLSITFYIMCLKRINNWNKCLVFMQSCKHLCWYPNHQYTLSYKLLEAILSLLPMPFCIVEPMRFMPWGSSGKRVSDVATPYYSHRPPASPTPTPNAAQTLGQGCELQREAYNMEKSTGHQRLFPSPCSPTLAMKWWPCDV